MLNRFVSRTWLLESFVSRIYVVNPFVSFCNKDLVAGRTTAEAVLSIPHPFFLVDTQVVRASCCSINTGA